MHSFVIGPTMSFRSWKARALTFQRYLVAPMTHHGSRCSLIFSFLLGPGTEQGAEAPVSTRNR